MSTESRDERPDWPSGYFDNLFDRRLTAASVPFLKATFKDGSEPEANRCHWNVDRWVSEHPDDLALRGWLVLGNPTEHWKFYPHSVVQSYDGAIFDLTPLADPLLFLRHLGDEGEFARILEAQCNDVTWKPIPAAMLSRPPS